MATKAERTMFVATESFGGEINGRPFNAVKGRTYLYSDHPAVSKWPMFFGRLEPTFETPNSEPRMEQATAAPGEKRGA